ncbi:hypothetical protein Ciccas_007317 [Cichlidogyrus casuarinus]|uniref:Uncharacterized protein n=1 Tax=Cichlidogyrus casuarinus TaxID=1844966 RepID=A0ABD2Q381_9PLAT
MVFKIQIQKLKASSKKAHPLQAPGDKTNSDPKELSNKRKAKEIKKTPLRLFYALLIDQFMREFLFSDSEIRTLEEEANDSDVFTVYTEMSLILSKDVSQDVAYSLIKAIIKLGYMGCDESNSDYIKVCENVLSVLEKKILHTKINVWIELLCKKTEQCCKEEKTFWEMKKKLVEICEDIITRQANGEILDIADENEDAFSGETTDGAKEDLCPELNGVERNTDEETSLGAVESCSPSDSFATNEENVSPLFKICVVLECYTICLESVSEVKSEEHLHLSAISLIQKQLEQTQIQAITATFQSENALKLITHFRKEKFVEFYSTLINEFMVNILFSEEKVKTLKIEAETSDLVTVLNDITGFLEKTVCQGVVSKLMFTIIKLGFMGCDGNNDYYIEVCQQVLDFLRKSPLFTEADKNWMIQLCDKAGKCCSNLDNIEENLVKFCQETKNKEIAGKNKFPLLRICTVLESFIICLQSVNEEKNEEHFLAMFLTQAQLLDIHTRVLALDSDAALQQKIEVTYTSSRDILSELEKCDKKNLTVLLENLALIGLMDFAGKFCKICDLFNTVINFITKNFTDEINQEMMKKFNNYLAKTSDDPCSELLLICSESKTHDKIDNRDPPMTTILLCLRSLVFIHNVVQSEEDFLLIILTQDQIRDIHSKVFALDNDAALQEKIKNAESNILSNSTKSDKENFNSLLENLALICIVDFAGKFCGIKELFDAVTCFILQNFVEGELDQEMINKFNDYMANIGENPSSDLFKICKEAKIQDEIEGRDPPMTTILLINQSLAYLQNLHKIYYEFKIETPNP